MIAPAATGPLLLRVMPGHEQQPKSRDALKELRRLVELVSLPPSPKAGSGRRLPLIGCGNATCGGDWDAVSGDGRKPGMHQQHQPSQRQSVGTHQQQHGGGNGGACQHQFSEINALKQFSLSNQNERNFFDSDLQESYSRIFTCLLTNRLFQSEWINHAPPENVFRVVNVLRILMRDSYYQKQFFEQGGLKILSQLLKKTTDSYMELGESSFIVDILKEITNIFQKLATNGEHRERIAACGAHEPLVLLLSSRDAIVLHCTLYALCSLAQSPQPRNLIGELNCIEKLLLILQDYDVTSQRVAANLLKLLCAESQAREMIKVCDGVPLLLSLLHSDNLKLLESVVWCVVKMAEDQDTSNDLRHMGVIPLLLSLLHDRSYSPEFPAVGTAPASASNLGRAMAHPLQSLAIEEEDAGTFAAYEKEGLDKKADKMTEEQLFLKAACCAALTELVRNDHNAQQIMDANGVYLIASLILPLEGLTEREKRAVENLQRHSMRTLRFLFSMERNRRLLRRIFPTDLFAKFVDVGHYAKDINAYKAVIERLNSLPESALEELRDSIVSTNQNRPATQHVGEYAVLEHLGSGSFGCVYKVQKKGASQSYYALKEVNLQGSGKGGKERDASELPIMKEQLKHPNIVKYHKTFIENDKLYIVMELIEGAPIGEHFISLKEKGERFTEERIWNIFIQMVLALRYLHKEKSIVHRDLSPNNIMLGDNDKVTITDFGLAKLQIKGESKLRSVVGTLLYSCPEIIQNMPYGEKSDIWAMGCLLYHMCTLQPPFNTSNVLSLAMQIVSGEYEPISHPGYSAKLKDVIRSCLTVCPDSRPDIVEVSSLISDKLMTHIEKSRTRESNLEKKLEKERKRTQRHFSKAHSYMQNYHRLFVANQERQIKVTASVTDSGSGVGAGSTNECDASDCFLSDNDAAVAAATIAEGKRRHVSADSQDSSVSNPSRGRPRRGLGGPDDQNNNRVVLWLANDDGDQSSSSGADSRESSSSGASLREMRRSEGVFAAKPAASMETCGSLDARQPLALDIPQVARSAQRDSGIESVEHSPCARNSTTAAAAATSGIAVQSEPSTPNKSTDSVFRRSVSSPQLDPRRQQSAGVGGVRGSNKGRPGSSGGAAKLTISPRKVRQISDPIQQMLNVLHKVIYISQLPPSLQYNPRRRLVEKFKRVLFAPQSSPTNLKSELKKVLTSSTDIIDLGVYDSSGPSPSNRHSNTDTDDVEAELRLGVTYEQMLGIIEAVLSESGYYDMSQQAQQRRMPALVPIGSMLTSKKY